MLCPVQGLSRSLPTALVALGLFAGAAQAQPAPQGQDVEAVIASAEYKELVREGMLKYTRGLWPEARAYFLKAHELAPNARTLRGLALVCYDSRHFVEAIDYGEQSLAHTVQPLNDKMVEELKQLIAQAQNSVTRAELVTTPTAAELRVDGALVTRRADGRVWLDPGEHELSVSAPGFFSETRLLQAATEQPIRLEIALKSRTAEGPASVAALRATAREPEPSAMPWVVVGVSGVVAAAGGVMLALDQANGDGHAAAWTPLGVTLLGVGAVGVIVGLTWSLLPRTEEHAASARLELSPLTVRLSGSF